MPDLAGKLEDKISRDVDAAMLESDTERKWWLL
jgi:hypothetical protein